MTFSRYTEQVQQRSHKEAMAAIHADAYFIRDTASNMLEHIDDDTLDAVSDAAEIVRKAQCLLHAVIDLARQEGVSWREVGSYAEALPEYLEAAFGGFDPDAHLAPGEGLHDWKPLG